jgi:hypothetical protein
VVQGATQLGQVALAPATLTATGTFTGAGPGAAQLFMFARSDTSGAGSYGLRVSQGNQTVLEDARPVPEDYSAGAIVGGYRFAASAATAGSYQLQLSDYAFPAAFASLRAVVSQAGSLTQTVAAAGTMTVPLAAGPVTVLVIAKPPSAASNGLFGLSLTPPSSTAAVIEGTQGVGGLFRTRNISVATAGSYDLSVSDLGFPDNFGELAVAATRGTSLVGQIFGGGKFSFSATPGTYSLNVLARLGTGANYGTWGFSLDTTPPPPVVTLSAGPAAITTQQTTTLQWSSSNATACTATGGWSGARAVSGSEASAALTADTTFTLACTGPGGSSSGSVKVTVSAANSSGGGGGALSLQWLLILWALTLWIVRCRVGRLN